MKQAAIWQNLCVPDFFDKTILHATELANAAPRRFAKTVSLNGVKHTLESDSPEGLQQAETEFFRKAFGDNADANGQEKTQEQPARDAASGRFVSQSQSTDAERAAEQAELELRFKRGEIPTDVYLSRSGAIERHLESQGISVDALRAVSAQNYEKSWSDAVEQFKTVNPDWVGGAANTQIMGQIIQASGLADKPSAESLQRAFEHAKGNGLLVPNEDAELESKIANATSHSEIQRLLGRPTSSSGGGHFGGR